VPRMHRCCARPRLSRRSANRPSGAVLLPGQVKISRFPTDHVISLFRISIATSCNLLEIVANAATWATRASPVPEPFEHVQWRSAARERRDAAADAAAIMRTASRRQVSACRRLIALIA
jgi:hypothetical protein